MDEFNCIAGLEEINTLAGRLPLSREQHEQMLQGFAAIRQSLIEGDTARARVLELEAADEERKAKSKRARKRARAK